MNGYTDIYELLNIDNSPPMSYETNNNDFYDYLYSNDNYEINNSSYNEDYYSDTEFYNESTTDDIYNYSYQLYENGEVTFDEMLLNQSLEKDIYDLSDIFDYETIDNYSYNDNDIYDYSYDLYQNGDVTFNEMLSMQSLPSEHPGSLEYDLYQQYLTDTYGPMSFEPPTNYESDTILDSSTINLDRYLEPIEDSKYIDLNDFINSYHLPNQENLNPYNDSLMNDYSSLVNFNPYGNMANNYHPPYFTQSNQNLLGNPTQNNQDFLKNMSILEKQQSDYSDYLNYLKDIGNKNYELNSTIANANIEHMKNLDDIAKEKLKIAKEQFDIWKSTAHAVSSQFSR